MWENLTRADIEQAKDELKLRRDAAMRRHAEEIRALDAEQAGIETIDRLVGALVEKLQIMTVAATPPAAPPPLEDTAEASEVGAEQEEAEAEDDVVGEESEPSDAPSVVERFGHFRHFAA